MNRNIIIIGAGGHGQVIADIVRANGDNLLGFLDDNLNKQVLGKIADYKKYVDAEFVIGIGNAVVRRKISSLPVKWCTLIHPSAVVSSSASVGAGTVVMPNVVINANAIIGRHCIVNSAAVVEHDNHVADFAHISVGAKLGGNVSIGDCSWVGIGATVINNVSVCEDCMIGAGAVVVRNISEKGTYIGLPARKQE
ncbi:MAG: NeuD/PglB/VioB family sugar acetyltransferase [Clostridia bacterium]|nr:NeuD/PglB/VioB family sugar acetyltransferase [Clostridia bacterium]